MDYTPRALGVDYAFVIGNSFFRELFAVWWLLVLNSRRAADLYNLSWVLLAVLLVLRVPFINSYLFLFESLTMSSWGGAHQHGFPEDTPWPYQALHSAFLLGAHVSGSILAAVTRVLLDAAYGVESMGSPPLVLGASGPGLATLPAWAQAAGRSSCLAGQTLSLTEPLMDPGQLCVSRSTMLVFFVGEEFLSTLMLLVVFFHMWMLLDRDQRRHPPGSSEYWQDLFKVSFLLVIVNSSLTRAFPTAHQGVHTTIYYYFYQMYNPAVQLLTADEVWARPVGSLVALAVAWGYHYMVRYSAPGGWAYLFLWGYIPDATDPSVFDKVVGMKASLGVAAFNKRV